MRRRSRRQRTNGPGRKTKKAWLSWSPPVPFAEFCFGQALIVAALTRRAIIPPAVHASRAREAFCSIVPYAMLRTQKLQGPVMIGRVSIAIAASVFGIALASYVPQIPEALRSLGGLTAAPLPVTEGFADVRKTDEASEDLPRTIRLDDGQIETAGIELAPVQDGTLTHRIIVPGTIVPNPDRIAEVSAKLSGTVAELRKKIGDNVAVGEVMAVLESRDVASAKSEYLAARLNGELQKKLYDRDKILWDKRLIAQQIELR